MATPGGWIESNERLRRKLKRLICLLLSFAVSATSLASFPGIASAADPVLLSSLHPGNTVTFAGYTWIVLGPDAADEDDPVYLLMKDAYEVAPDECEMTFDWGVNKPPWNLPCSPFDPARSTNIAFYLNEDEEGPLMKMTPEEQAMIASHDWTTGGQGNESATTANCKIGLLSYSEYGDYTDDGNDFTIIGNTVRSFWTRTNYYDNEVFWYAEGYKEDGLITVDGMNGSPSNQEHVVRPALYLKPGTRVSGGIDGDGGAVVIDGLPAISGVGLGRDSHVFGASGDDVLVSVTVSTSNVPDETTVTATLVGPDKEDLGLEPAIAVQDLISGNGITLPLYLPPDLSPGSYLVETSVDGVDTREYSPYTVNYPAPAVTLDVTSSHERTAVDIPVHVDAADLEIGTTLQVTLADKDRINVGDVGVFNCSVTEDKTAGLTLSLPATLDAGDYFVKVTATGMDTGYAAYTIESVAPTVELDPTTGELLANKSLTVTISDVDVDDGTTVTASLLDNLKRALPSPITATGAIQNPQTTLTLNIPAVTPGEGTYYVEVAVVGIEAKGYAQYDIVDTRPLGTVTVLASPAHGGSVTGAGQYHLGDWVTITANHDADHSFVNWTTADGEFWSTPTCSFQITDAMVQNNLTLTANFRVRHRDPEPVVPVVPVVPVIVAPKVATDAATDVSSNGAVLNGHIVNAGGGECSAGFQYRMVGDSAWKSIGADGGALGDGDRFSAEIGNLKPNSTYEFRTKASNQAGSDQGSTRRFVVLGVPAVTTEDASELNLDAARLNGSITNIADMSAAPVTDSGFMWGTSPGRLKKASVDADPDGALTLKLTGLKANAKYYFEAYATNAAGTAYGDVLEFLTPALLVLTGGVADVGLDCATASGSAYITPGSGAVTSCGFIYGEEADLSDGVKAESETLPRFSDAGYSTTLLELKAGTTYYYQAFAANASGEAYGSILSLVTLTDAPVVETRDATLLMAISANLNGYIVNNNGLEISESGFLWGSDPVPANRLQVVPGSDRCTLSSLLEGLTSNTTYYVRAFATNSIGTGYGATVSFVTPLTVPVVTTTSAVFDVAQGGAVLDGTIVTNGGLPLGEYGFRLSGDQQTWVNLVIGTQDYTGDFTSAGVNNLDRLLPSTTYYVQAYAKNSAGFGYGESATFITPDLPSVTGSLDDSGSGATAATLSGSITGTGGEGVSCTAYQFQYRAAGADDWTTVGTVEGAFGAGPFSYGLSGLRPGTKYEFRAQARNCVGWSSTDVIPFATTWGATDEECAVVMKGAGFSLVEIANTLKNVFGDSDVAAFQALQSAGFLAVDCAGALKNSEYGDSTNGVSTVLYGSGLSAPDAATVLRQVFYNNDRDVAVTLVMGGYSIEDVTRALKDVFKDLSTRAIAALNGYPLPEVYNAVYKVYGVWELVNYLSDKYAGTSERQLLVSYLHAANLDAIQATQVMQSRISDYRDYNPYSRVMSVEFALPKMLATAGYSAAEIGSALVQVLGVDPSMLYGALTGQIAQTNLFPAVEAVDFLVTNLQLSLRQMAQVLAKWQPNQPTYDMMMLMDKYKPTAQELVSALWAGGWTKVGLGESQVGLDMPVYFLVNQYGLKSPGDIIGALRQAGVSALDVAKEMDAQMAFLAPYAGVSATSDAWRPAWLKAYQQQGYTAADVVKWDRSSGNSNDYYHNVLLLAQLGYNLNDIVMGMKTAWGWNAVEAADGLSNANGYNKTGWPESAINQAIRDVYGPQDLPALVRDMRSQGDGATAVASILRETFAVSDPVEAAKHMQGSYFEADVLTALVQTYTPLHSSGTKAAMEMLLKVESKVYKKSGITVFTLQCLTSTAGNDLRYVGPDEAVATLTSCGYSADQIIPLLKAPPTGGYGLDAGSALLKLCPGGEPLAASIDLIAAVKKAYSVDAIAIAVGLGRKDGAGTALAWLNRTVGDIQKEAAYLKDAGYPQMSVLEAIENQFPNAETVFKVLKDVYGVADAAAMLVEVKTFLGAYAKNPQFMYEIIRSLYNVDLKTAVLLVRDVGEVPVYNRRSGSWVEDVVTAKDPGLAAILGSANPGDLELPPEYAVRILSKMGYGLKETTAWMVKDNYAWGDLFKQVMYRFYPGKSDPVQLLRDLKGLYDVADLARGDYGCYGNPDNYVKYYYRVHNDLRAAGYGVSEAAGAVLKMGGGDAVSDVILAWQDASSSKIPAQTMVANLVVVSLNTTGLTLDLTAVGNALLNLGPGRAYPLYSWDDLYNGMYVVADLFNRANGTNDDRNIMALHMLYVAGMTAYEAADVEAAEGVGLSAGDIIRSVVGFDSPWFEAVENLAQAGYGFKESIEAVWNNEAYHTLIGMSILSSMITSAVSVLQMAPKISAAIKLYQNLDKIGFMINDASKGNYKSAAMKGGLLVLSNIPMGAK